MSFCLTLLPEVAIPGGIAACIKGPRRPVLICGSCGSKAYSLFYTRPGTCTVIKASR